MYISFVAFDAWGLLGVVDHVCYVFAKIDYCLYLQERILYRNYALGFPPSWAW